MNSNIPRTFTDIEIIHEQSPHPPPTKQLSGREERRLEGVSKITLWQSDQCDGWLEVEGIALTVIIDAGD